MNQIKYITSGGLAFSENKDMEKLRRYSLKGRHVFDFSFMGYSLERGKKSDYIYSIDYRWLKEDEKKEYFDFFSSAGWTHVNSEGNIHLFRAQPGTKPIYTDSDSTIEKYRSSSSMMKNLAIPSMLMTALSWVGVMNSSGTLKSLLIVIATILSAISVPAVWTAITTYSNKWKAEGRRGLANIVSIIPYLLLVIAVIILFFVSGTGSAVNIIAAGVIGGIVLPTAIWIIVSLYHKLSRN